MKRKLLTFFSALSLLLWVAVCILWVRSYWCVDWVEWIVDPRRMYIATSEKGTISVARESIVGKGGGGSTSFTTTGSPFDFGSKAAEEHSVPVDPALTVMGFAFDHNRVLGGTTSYWESDSFLVPSWFPAAMLALLPFLWFWSWQRDRLAQKVGRCRRCGYDLRATPDRCPECGTASSAA